MKRPPVWALALLLLASAGPAFAAWPALGRAVVADPNDQEGARVASDGANGAIIVWQDFRSTRINVFARRVLANGEPDPAWPVNGRALLADSVALAGAFGGQAFPVIVADGSGGAIVAWEDDRSQASGTDIFAQHVLASGAVDPAWPANGRALCTAEGQQDIPAIASDGVGGAIVTWMDARTGASLVDAYAQHVLASGAVDPGWPINGVAVSTAPGAQAFPKPVSDGSGGAIVSWYDSRPGFSGLDVYAQHVRASGTVDPLWLANGMPLSIAVGSQIDPAIVSDGAHGAIVTWEDARDGVVHIYATRVLVTSAIAAGWPLNGRAICLADIGQTDPVIASDGAGGAIVSWMDARNGVSHDPFAQHVLAAGVIDAGWPVNGRALSLSPDDASDGVIVADGVGGAFVAWEEELNILTQHILAGGTADPSFPADGRFARPLLAIQHSPDLVMSTPGNAIVAFSDAGLTNRADIYAQIVVGGGVVGADPGTLPAAITFAPPAPSPSSGPVALRFTLPRATCVSLSVYDVAGRRVRQLADGDRPAGDQQATWDLADDAGRAVRPGVYFVRLAADGEVQTRRISRLP